MLGYHSLSAAPLSAFVIPPGSFSFGQAIGAAVVNGVALSTSTAIGTAIGVAIVFSDNAPTEIFSILRGMSKQKVNSTATMTDDPITILGTFI